MSFCIIEINPYIIRLQDFKNLGLHSVAEHKILYKMTKLYFISDYEIFKNQNFVRCLNFETKQLKYR